MSQQYAPNTTQFKLSRTIAPFHEEEMEPEPLALRPSHVEVAAPGARGTVMLKAPLAEVPETKRAPMIIEQDQSLVETTVDLEEGTKRRNRELHEKLSAIEQRGVHWEVRARAPRRRARVSRSSRARRGAASARPVGPVDVAEERDVGRRAQRHTGRLSVAPSMGRQRRTMHARRPRRVAETDGEGLGRAVVVAELQRLSRVQVFRFSRTATSGPPSVDSSTLLLLLRRRASPPIHPHAAACARDATPRATERAPPPHPHHMSPRHKNTHRSKTKLVLRREAPRHAVSRLLPARLSSPHSPTNHTPPP